MQGFLERQSLSAKQAAKPQVVVGCGERNLEKPNLRPPGLKMKHFGAQRAPLQRASRGSHADSWGGCPSARRWPGLATDGRFDRLSRSAGSTASECPAIRAHEFDRPITGPERPGLQKR
jgi:hypothetical protein